ncbi:MAG: hypothetical protein IID36_05365 [Planctomycetes bacterium]|nr:hypothetical protein [Planctomycetota bacterium]
MTRGAISPCHTFQQTDRDLGKLAKRVSAGRLKNADKVLETIRRCRERWPAASRFVFVDVDRNEDGQAASVS